MKGLIFDLARVLKPCLRYIDLERLAKCVSKFIDGLEAGSVTPQDAAERVIDGCVPEEKRVDVFDQYYEDIVQVFRERTL